MLLQSSAKQIKRRGCAVIKGHFPREQALGWDQSMLDYLDRNRFDEVYKGPGDNFFGTLERFTSRDLPHLLVAGANAGPPE